MIGRFAVAQLLCCSLVRSSPGSSARGLSPGGLRAVSGVGSVFRRLSCSGASALASVSACCRSWLVARLAVFSCWRLPAVGWLVALAVSGCLLAWSGGLVRLPIRLRICSDQRLFCSLVSSCRSTFILLACL